jgi:hypothetical protein
MWIRRLKYLIELDKKLKLFKLRKSRLHYLAFLISSEVLKE